MAEFPPDLIWEILRLLPVTSLLRFKCISKSFHRIVESRGFIDLHLNATLEHKTHRKLVFQKNPQLVPLDFDDLFQPLPNFLLKNPLPESHNDSRSKIDRVSHISEDSGSKDGNNQVSEPYCCRFYGHCNGLVLKVEHYRGETWGTRFRVWNPFTRKFWTLQHQWRRWIKACSFGYDPCKDDYKVLLVCPVRFYEHLEPCEGCDYCYLMHDEIWMVGLKSGFWKKIGDHNPTPASCWWVRDVCFVDGAFYFVLDGREIYAIDAFEEKVSPVSLPNDISDIISLQVLDGCLCVGFFRHCRIRCSDDDDEKEEEKKEAEELYVRKKNDSGEFFWTKLVSFAYEEHFSGLYFGSAIEGRLLGYSKRGDKLFILHNGFGRKLYFYDFEEKSVKRIRNGHIKNCLHVIFCVESLASLDPYLIRKEENDESTLDQI